MGVSCETLLRTFAMDLEQQASELAEQRAKIMRELQELETHGTGEDGGLSSIELAVKTDEETAQTSSAPQPHAEEAKYPAGFESSVRDASTARPSRGTGGSAALASTPQTAQQENSAGQRQTSAQERAPINKHGGKNFYELLLDCEKEVRDAKGFSDLEAAARGEIKVLRVRKGESAPKHAKLLCKVPNTGVDFTVPINVVGYSDVVKTPICLNEIRDKIRQGEYWKAEQYLQDMELLARNTHAFNRGPDVDWICQHADIMLEVAHDAVLARGEALDAAEKELETGLVVLPERAKRNSNRNSLDSDRPRGFGGSPAGKQQQQEELPEVDSMIQIYSSTHRKWRTARLMSYNRDRTRAVVYYEELGGEGEVDMVHGKWKLAPVEPQTLAKTSITSTQATVQQQASPQRRASGSSGGEHKRRRTTDEPAQLSLAVDEGLLDRLEEIKSTVGEQLTAQVRGIDAKLETLSQPVVEFDDAKLGVLLDKLESRCRVLIETAKIEIDTKLTLLLAQKEARMIEAVDRVVNSRMEEWVARMDADRKARHHHHHHHGSRGSIHKDANHSNSVGDRSTAEQPGTAGGASRGFELSDSLSKSPPVYEQLPIGSRLSPRAAAVLGVDSGILMNGGVELSAHHDEPTSEGNGAAGMRSAGNAEAVKPGPALQKQFYGDDVVELETAAVAEEPEPEPALTMDTEGHPNQRVHMDIEP
ncbi:Protein lin-49 [Porphyridium purpureum]|uniref:Protein lin-49 n=1 Tax=Porphyridium purpureum TaxID=35688 RepID=A0A5J4Z765_PORPP|nr:Protein lin-49 [Porphyridium purpureum]|eukprot:POR6644..scf295_1